VVDSGAPKELAAGLDEAERLLLLLREELYGGSWSELLEDLRARQAHRPYIFKLASNIREDIARIERLQEYERRHGVDLAACLPPASPTHPGQA